MSPAGTPPPDAQANAKAVDCIAEEIEETLPEGPSPKGDSRAPQGVLFAFGAVALAALVVMLFVRGGWPAGAVGLVFLFLYAFIGSTPWWASTFRARDQREVRTVIAHELAAGRTNQGSQPPP